MIQPSTFSIVAYDPRENAWGIAVASKFLAVGAVVPWARAGCGAIATQSYANTAYGPLGLAMLADGLSSQEVLDSLVSDDEQAQQRQVGIVDANGRAATFTGEACSDWAGGITGDYFAIQGNILTGENVILAMAREFQNATGGSLTWRLYHALLAGDRAGGDRRGRQSASILVVKPQAGYGGFNDRWVDYRVDDHPNPVLRLGEILNLHDLYFGRSTEEDRVPLVGEALLPMQRLMKKLGYFHGNIDGNYSTETRKALRSFVGNENFEERVDFEKGWMDKPIYDYLILNFGAEA